LAAAWVIPKIESDIFENIIGVALILLVPTLFINKKAFQPGERTKKWVVVGYALYLFFCMLSALISTGVGSILVLVLMFCFGLSALEANATKRIAQAVQSVLLVVLLALQGLVVWLHAVASLIGCIIGSHVGGMIAIKKGSKFVKIMLAVTMVTAGVALLIW